MLMPSTKKIKCIITGKQTVYSGDFLQKKIQEYGSEEKLNMLYICREVKSFFKKGYGVYDIRKILNVDDNLPLPDETTLKEIEDTFRKESILISQIPTLKSS